MSAPGRRVATGRLRVDAGRAVAKLREYQLLERRLWILEALRGAVGAGAEAITVDADADDVWVGWEGAPPPEAELGALLDELVSPAVDPKRRWARLLATAVNTALGEGTRFVDVWRFDGEDCVGFRYAPALLQERDEDDQALRPIRHQDERPPAPRVPARGVLIQVRRRFGASVMGRWLTGAEPPELQLLREVSAQARSRVPLTIHDEAIERDSDVLLSVPLGERAQLVLFRTEAIGPRPFLCHWLELGVPLSMTVPLEEASLRGVVPAGLLYDSDRLPTNAARSEVRLDEGGLDHVVQRAVAKGLDELVQATMEAYEEALTAGDEARAEALRGAMLAWIGAHCGGVDWRNALGGIPSYLRPFRKVELVRNAVGQWKRLGAIDSGAVLRTEEPEEPDLEPWLKRVLWAPPGDPAAFLFARQSPPSPRRQLRDANRALAAKRRWLEHEQRPAEIPDQPGQWLSVRFGRDENRGRSALPLKRHDRTQHGEVCLLDPLAVAPSQEGIGQVTLLHHGRPLGSARFLSPIPYQAVVESGHLRPTGDYRDCEPNKGYEDALVAAQVFALRAAELLLAQIEDHERELPACARLRQSLDAEERLEPLRGAVHRAVERRDLDAKQVVSQLRGAFRDAPIFDLHEDDDVQRVSLRELCERFETEEVVVQAASPDQLPAGRPLVFDVVAARLLRRRFPRKVVVQYDASLASKRPRMDERAISAAIWRPDYPMLEVDLGDVRGAIAWSGLTHGSSVLHRMHRGVRIDQLPFEAAFEHCKVAMDDDRLIPTPGWDGAAFQPDLEEQLGRFEQAICRAVVDALAGKEVGGLRIRGDIRKLSHVHEAVLRAATHMDALDPARDRLLRELPLLPTVGGEKRSLNDVAQETEIAWVERHEAHLSGVPTELLIAGRAQAEVLAELTGRTVRHAKRELDEARRNYRRTTNLALHRRQPERSIPEPSPLGAEVVGKHIVEGVAELATGGLPRTRVDVRIEGRAFSHLEADGPPIDAIVEVELGLGAATAELDGLKAGVSDALLRRVWRAMGTMLERMATHSPRLLHDHHGWGVLLDHWLDEHFLEHSKSSRRTRHALTAAVAYPATQAGLTSIDAASSDKQVRVSEPLGEWLFPEDGEERHYLDSPTLAIGEPHRGRVERLALGKRLYDSTRSMRRLQDSRRIEQGLVERPSLRQIPPERKATLEELGGASRRRWMIGEIGLNPSREASLVVYAGGRPTRTIPLDMEPTVQIALEASDLAEEGATLPSSLRAHLQELLRRLLVQKILPGLDALPRWVDAAVRRAWLLEDLLDDDDVEQLPLFESTAGTRLSLEEVRAQAKRFDGVWVTTATSFLERTRLPFDPERVALRLTVEEMAKLAVKVDVVDAEEELKLDETLRRNRARPPVESLDLPASVKPMLLAERTFGEGPLEGSIGLLHGGARADLARVLVSRERVPLGDMPSPAGWPVVAVLDDGRLTPDRVHGAPEADQAWAWATGALRKARSAMWRELIPDPPDGALASVEVKRNPFWGSARGRLWLGNPRHAGSVQVAFGRVAQPVTPKIEGHPIPLRGNLWVAHREGERYTQTQGVLADSFVRLCRRIENEASAKKPDLFAVLLRAELIDAFECRDSVRDRALPGLGGVSIAALRNAQRAGLKEVRALLPTGLGDAPRVIRAVLGQSFPSWVLRGRREAAPVAREPAKPPSSSTTRRRKGAKQKKKKRKPRRKAHPLDFLAAALGKALREMGMATKVLVAPRRKKHLVVFDESQNALLLSGAHPQLVALQAEQVARGANADRAMRLLVAHAVGVLDRALQAVTAASQHHATQTLLGQPPRS